jgi:hypothetical protein
MRTLVIASACLLVSAEAAAQEERPLDHGTVDFEVRPNAGLAFVPQSLTNMFVGADVGVRFNRFFELALDGAWYSPFDGTPSTSQPVNEGRWSAGVDLAFFPFAAAARRREGPGTFEPYALAGLGAIVTRPVAVVDPVNRRFDDQTLVDLSVALGARLFATRWLAVNLEVRDMMYFDKMENPSVAGGSTSLALSDPNNPANPSTWYDPRSHFTNAVQLRLGGSFVLGAR